MKSLKFSLLMAVAILFVNCDSDDDAGIVGPDNPETKMYTLGEVGSSGVSGVAIFEDQQNGSTKITLDLDGTPQGASHPSHIHMNSAAEGGDILISLEPVNGSTGISTTIVDETDGGNAISFDDLLFVDGYINVHLSADDIGTIVAQGDVGQNELTGEMKTYNLGERDVEGISGEIVFEERVNGFALATIQLDGTPDGGMHPAHIHMNTALETGGILFTFKPVDGSTGMSVSDTSSGQGEDESSYTYAEILEIDGYVNVHLSADDLGTIVAQGDIGENELTGEMKTYELGERDVEGISGEIVFEERVNGFALATIQLDGTPDGGMHPAHIHMNTALETGGILFTFKPVDGSTGMSVSDTSLGQAEGESSYTYADILEIDGYINVHLSADDLGTIVAQGDIGENELTGESITYPLSEIDVTGISGDILFEERANGEALATITLMGTPDGGMHPAHIHANSAAESGDIIFTFTPVDGTTGMSMTNVSMLDDDSSFGYEDVLTVDGYVNVHLSADEITTIVGQGDIGMNF